MNTLVARVTELFPAGVRVALAPIDAVPVFRHELEAVAVARAVETRQRQYATGRRLAHELLDALGCPDAPLEVAPDRAPTWPSGVVGSIAHTEGLCVVAVAPADRFGSLGVDHEPPTPLEHDLWPTVLRPVEAEWLAGRPESEQGRLAKLVFSAKESAYKALASSVRTILEFEDVELRIDTTGRRIEATLRRDDLTVPCRTLHGRYALEAEALFTAFTVPAAPDG